MIATSAPRTENRFGHLLNGTWVQHRTSYKVGAACAGNGVLFDDAEACVCFDCWSGPTCAESLSGDACVVQVAVALTPDPTQAGSGRPVLYVN